MAEQSIVVNHLTLKLTDRSDGKIEFVVIDAGRERSFTVLTKEQCARLGDVFKIIGKG